ncbi:MAG: hypothetical protein U0L73_02720 [Ruminococcus bromii]|nr:hypothetical protein [Ruminococcus bromii]
MAKKKYEEANIEAIADTIREKTGSEKTYKTKDMAEGVGEVFEAGKQAENDAFWDGFLDRGERKVFTMAFANWRCEYIRPNRKIIFNYIEGDRAYSVFQRCTNLKEIKKEYFDFSQYTPKPDLSTGGWYYTFNNLRALEYFEDLGCQAGGYYYTWAYGLSLHTVEVMRCCEEGVYAQPFHGCSKLVNLTIEGVIGTSFPIQYSPLSPASLKSVVKHLKNYSGIADHTQTLTVKASAWEALEAEGLNDEDKAWLISLMPYVEEDIDYVTWATVVDFFSWNLVLA